MKRLPLPSKLKKHRKILIIALGISLYLVFAYSYFFYKIHSTKLNWPAKKYTYQFNSSAPSQKMYVALGDSLTYGFGVDDYKDSYTYQVARGLAGNKQGVVLKDFSYPGYKVDDVTEILDAAIANKPDVATVFIGVNDTHHLIQTQDFAKKYEYIISRLSRETSARIYAINLPYLGANPILLPPYSYYFDAKTRSHNKVIKKLAKKYGAVYIDLYGPTVEVFKKEGPHYCIDLYHPSAEGYKMWANIIDNAIRK